MAIGPEASGTHTEDPQSVNPSDAEVEEWAGRERRRREAWLKGPTETEKAIWAQREQERRLSGSESSSRARGFPGDSARIVQRYAREMQLAAEGAMSLLMKLSVQDAFDQLVRAGRDWEEDFMSQPPRRRRVPLEADSAERGTSSAAGSVPAQPEGPRRSG
jgi:hypothetical protein